MSRTSILVLACLLAACAASPEKQLEKARERLTAGDLAAAGEAANAGLGGGATGPVAWRLELTALESEARRGLTAQVLARLERLAGTWASQLNGGLYVQTARQVKEAGDAAGAITVLDAGAKRLPKDTAISQAIAQAKGTENSAELERLRCLGHVE